jgi:hypothetical protein
MHQMMLPFKQMSMVCRYYSLLFILSSSNVLDNPALSLLSLPAIVISDSSSLSVTLCMSVSSCLSGYITAFLATVSDTEQPPIPPALQNVFRIGAQSGSSKYVLTMHDIFVVHIYVHSPDSDIHSTHISFCLLSLVSCLLSLVCASLTLHPCSLTWTSVCALVKLQFQHVCTQPPRFPVCVCASVPPPRSPFPCMSNADSFLTLPSPPLSLRRLSMALSKILAAVPQKMDRHSKNATI